MGEIFHEEGSFQGVNFSGEILQRGHLPEFLYDTLLMSCFLLSNSLLCMDMLRITVQDKFQKD